MKLVGRLPEWLTYSKFSLVPKASTIELILRLAVKEQELFAIPNVFDDEWIRTP